MEVKIRIHAGGAWEGNVVYTLINPNNANDKRMFGSISAAVKFCSENNLTLDGNFILLVKKHLVFEHGKGLVIPNSEIDENLPITSATKFLKRKFNNYIE